jgi:hypothetical protein
LREIIWGYAFGSRTIHPLSNRGYNATGVGRITYHECYEPLSPPTIYELSLQGAKDDDPFRWKAEALQRQSLYGYPVFSGVHDDCKNRPSSGIQFGAPLVCKQIYYEAMPIAWQTTTFCFMESVGFQDFVRTPSAKKHLIKHLAINPGGFRNGWDAAVTSLAVASFSALESLHLILTGMWYARNVDALKSPPSTLRFLPNLIKQFQRVPLKADMTTVWVAVYDPVTNAPVMGMPPPQRTFTVERQREVAEHVKGLLLQYKPRRPTRMTRDLGMS